MQCQKTETNEGDKMWNSQEWHTDVRSMASTGDPVTRNSVIDVDFETSGGYSLLSAEISLTHRKSEYDTASMYRPPGDKMDYIGKHSLSWGIFMSSTMNAAVFLGRDYSENLQSVRSTNEKPTEKKLFEVTQRL